MIAWMPEVGPPRPYFMPVPAAFSVPAHILSLRGLKLSERSAWAFVDVYAAASLDETAPPGMELVPFLAEALAARPHLTWAMRQLGWKRRPKWA